MKRVQIFKFHRYFLTIDWSFLKVKSGNERENDGEGDEVVLLKFWFCIGTRWELREMFFVFFNEFVN